MELISVGHNFFLLKVEIRWVQDPGPSPKSSNAKSTLKSNLQVAYRFKDVMLDEQDLCLYIIIPSLQCAYICNFSWWTNGFNGLRPLNA